MNARESFPRLLLAEWTKLRSVSRWVLTLFGAVALTIGLSYLAGSGNKWDARSQAFYTTGPLGDPVSDSFYYVHQQVTGDTTLTVHLASVAREPDQRAPQLRPGMSKVKNPGPWAQPAGGIMIKDGTTTGSSYAAVLLTPTKGVHMQWDFDADRKGSTSTGTGGRWLRLVRSGQTITGYESADGLTWQQIATATPKHLPATVEVGLYVSSPDDLYVHHGVASGELDNIPTRTQAVFDNVQLASAGAWHGDTLGKQPPADKEGVSEPSGRYTETGGTFTVRGAGLIGPDAPDDDLMEAALIGVIAGIMALIAVGVLYATAEYRRGMIRTTFLATPRRGRVLAAKALVLGATAYVVGLVGVFGSYLVAIPVLRDKGFVEPAFPRPSLADGPVLRTLLLTAGFMAGVALVGLGIGMLLRHSAAAITVTVVLVLLPLIAGTIVPGTTSPKWLMYTTLAGGMATERAKPPTVTLAEPWALIGPWPGITVVAVWVAVALGLAWWRLRTRDV